MLLNLFYTTNSHTDTSLYYFCQIKAIFTRQFTYKIYHFRRDFASNIIFLTYFLF